MKKGSKVKEKKEKQTIEIKEKKHLFNKRTLVILCVILFLALIVRLWGINFGLPDVFYVDGGKIVYPAKRIATNLLNGRFDIDPKSYQYPTLFFNILAVEYVAAGIIGYFCNHFFGEKETYKVYVNNLLMDESRHYIFHLLARLTSALAGVATVFVMYLLGMAISNGDKRTGIISALFLAFMYFHVKESKYPMTDAMMGVFSTLAIVYILNIFINGRNKDFILSGVFIGLGGATKYMPFALLLPFSVAACARWYKEEGLKWNNRVAKGICIGLLFTLLAFSVGSPITLFRLGTYTKRVTHEATSKGAKIGSTQRGYFDYLFSKTPVWNEPYAENSLAGSMGLPMLLLALIALLYMLYKTAIEGIKKHGVYAVLLVYFFAYYFYLAKPSGMKVVRYFFMLMPVLAAISAYFLVEMISRLKAGERMKNIIITVCALLIILPTAVDAVRYDYLMMHQDTRIEAAKWITENIPVNSMLLMPNIYSPPIKGDGYKIVNYSKAIVNKKVLNYDILLKNKIDYVIISSYFYNRYLCEEALWSAHDIVSYQRSFYQSLDERALLVKVIESNLTDRPGPTIKIYKIIR